MTITLYRCYWPSVYKYLKPLELEKSVEETFGYVLSLNLPKNHVNVISRMLPVGAVIEIVDQEQNKQGPELDEILRTYGLGDDWQKYEL